MFHIADRLKTLWKAPVFAAALMIYAQVGCQAAPTKSVALDAGFQQMYNLDFSAAHKTFEGWQQLHPDDPLGAASNAAAYLFDEFERLHILQFELFMDDKRFEKVDDVSPDPQIRSAFEAELAKADDLAEKILAQSSNDRDALFAKTLTDGLRGNYAALIAKQKRSALDFLKSSRSTAERLIAIDPNYSDAYLAVGIENYVLGVRSAPTRWMLHLTGAQTNKNKGIASLKVTAEKGRYLGPYARLLLSIAYLRDNDKSAAKKLLAGLAREFPQNRLYQAELERF